MKKKEIIKIVDLVFNRWTQLQNVSYIYIPSKAEESAHIKDKYTAVSHNMLAEVPDNEPPHYVRID